MYCSKAYRMVPEALGLLKAGCGALSGAGLGARRASSSPAEGPHGRAGPRRAVPQRLPFLSGAGEAVAAAAQQMMAADVGVVSSSSQMSAYTWFDRTKQNN